MGSWGFMFRLRENSLSTCEFEKFHSSPQVTISTIRVGMTGLSRYGAHYPLDRSRLPTPWAGIVSAHRFEHTNLRKNVTSIMNKHEGKEDLSFITTSRRLPQFSIPNPPDEIGLIWHLNRMRRIKVEANKYHLQVNDPLESSPNACTSWYDLPILPHVNALASCWGMRRRLPSLW